MEEIKDYVYDAKENNDDLLDFLMKFEKVKNRMEELLDKPKKLNISEEILELPYEINYENEKMNLYSQMMTELKDKNSEIKRAFKSIEDKIEKCHKLMIGNSDKLNINNNPKSLNDILERIYWKIKQDIHGKEAKVINEIYEREKNFINGK